MKRFGGGLERGLEAVWRGFREVWKKTGGLVRWFGGGYKKFGRDLDGVWRGFGGGLEGSWRGFRTRLEGVLEGPCRVGFGAQTPPRR